MLRFELIHYLFSVSSTHSHPEVDPVPLSILTSLLVSIEHTESAIQVRGQQLLSVDSLPGATGQTPIARAYCNDRRLEDFQIFQAKA